MVFKQQTSIFVQRITLPLDRHKTIHTVQPYVVTIFRKDTERVSNVALVQRALFSLYVMLFPRLHLHGTHRSDFGLVKKT